MGDVIQYCHACGASHADSEVPQLCYNLLLLAGGIRNYLLEEDPEDAANELLVIACEVLGEELQDDDEEVFSDND